MSCMYDIQNIQCNGNIVYYYCSLQLYCVGGKMFLFCSAVTVATFLCACVCSLCVCTKWKMVNVMMFFYEMVRATVFSI